MDAIWILSFWWCVNVAVCVGGEYVYVWLVGMGCVGECVSVSVYVRVPSVWNKRNIEDSTFKLVAKPMYTSNLLSRGDY